MSMVGRQFGGYRYGFNGKENEIEAGTQDYGMRMYDSRVGRFFTVDPLTKDYPWYTPYQFAGDKPIKFVDLDGMEEGEHVFTQSLFHWIFPPRHPVTPAAIISTQVSLGAQNFTNSRVGKFTNGMVNTVLGSVGIISSVTYILGSDGVGGALGGTAALQLSISTSSIGIAQMIDVLASKNTNNTLQSASNLPGLIAYGLNSKYAPFIDAFSALGPSMATSNGIKTFLKGGLGLREAFESFVKDPSLVTALGGIDQVKSVYGFSVESVKLVNSFDINKKLNGQTLSYKLSYKIQKGDNLKEIAKKLSTSIDTLIKQNNISDPNRISEGQTLNYSNVVGAKIK